MYARGLNKAGQKSTKGQAGRTAIEWLSVNSCTQATRTMPFASVKRALNCADKCRKHQNR
jgi:hypothetical protein